MVVAVLRLSAGVIGIVVRVIGDLLLLVLTAEAKLCKSRDQEEKSTDNGDDEDRFIEFTSCAERHGIRNLFALTVAIETLTRTGLSVAERRTHVVA